MRRVSLAAAAAAAATTKGGIDVACQRIGHGDARLLAVSRAERGFRCAPRRKVSGGQ